MVCVEYRDSDPISQQIRKLQKSTWRVNNSAVIRNNLDRQYRRGIV